MSKKFEYIVYLGRFEPSHKGHIHTILEALKLSERVIVICGSAHQPRSPKNPWTVTERWGMIQNALAEVLDQKDLNRVTYSFCYDYIYNEQRWIEEVQAKVMNLIPTPDAEIGIIGHHKDETSYYLDSFPQWKQVEMKNIELLNATQIREAYFSTGWGITRNGSSSIPKSVEEFLAEWKETDEYKLVQGEWDARKNYKYSWTNCPHCGEKSAPYDITFTTTDAVVVCKGHVLLVKRKLAPGKGNWALPGGFIDTNQKIQDSMIRELREETRLKIPIPVLIGSIKDSNVFDDPGRSQRGRTITHAFLLEVAADADGSLPKVKGGDDAEKAKWIPLADLDNKRDKMFEDHSDIINYFVSRI